MKKSVSVLSLRSLLMVLVGLLVLTALTFAVSALQENRGAYRDAMLLAERNRVADNCLQAVKSFAFERGRSNVVLRRAGPITPEYRRFIGDHRAEADARIGEVLGQLPELFREKGDAVRRAWEVVRAMRPALERDFPRPLAERDPELRGQWLTAANALVSSLELLLIDVSSFSANRDAGFERLNNLRTLALQFRNLVGTESTAFAAELSAERVPSRETINALNVLRGRSIQMWTQLELGVLSLADRDSSAALEKVRSIFLGQLRPLQDTVVHAASDGARTAIDAERYIATSVAALNSTVELADGINRAAAALTQDRLEQAKRQERLALAIIAAIVILAGLVATLLVRRFTWPLNEIVARINALLDAQSDTARIASPAVGGDEFARVRQALELLDAALEGRRRSEEALNESERISGSILACVPQSIVATDIDGRITVFSPGAENMLGYSANEVVNMQTPALFFDPEEIRARADALSKELGFFVEPGLEVLMPRSKTGIKADEREWTCMRKDGTRLTVLVETTLLRNAHGEVDGYLGVATDITERKQMENELRRRGIEHDKQNSLLNALLQTIPVGVLMVEAPSGKLLLVNDAALVLLGRRDLPGAKADDFSQIYGAYKLPDRIPYPVEEWPVVLGMRGLSSHVEDVMIVLPDGAERVLEVMGSPVRDGEGRIWASVMSLIDMTDRSQAKARMSRLAYHDHLTQLPNRRLFHDRMQMAITQARREGGRLALLLIDLDKFKPVNDNHGHLVGDRLLQVVATRMQACLRESDTLARIGGDEFVAILSGIGEDRDALGVAEKIRLALNEHFDLGESYRISIACSIGIAIYPDHGKDETHLLKNADEAMYTAKELGRNGVYLFNGVIGGSATNLAARRDESIVRVVWHRSYRCGEASIDREHHELFDRANTLIHAFLSGGSDPVNLQATIDDLVDCVASHFANEEGVLARYAYEDLEDHVRKHQALVGRALELRSMAMAGEMTLGDLITFLAQDVVAKHMLVEDRKFFPVLKKALHRQRTEFTMGLHEH